MAKINFTPADDLVDEVWGKKGTPKRDTMEVQLKEEINAHLVGEAIKRARIQQNLTQEQLGEKIGVKSLKYQSWKVESVLSLYRQ